MMASNLVLFPGSFDPFTNGHLDVVRTAADLFDRVEIAVGINSSKTPVLTVDERCTLIEEAVAALDNVAVGRFDGLVVDYAVSVGAIAIVRGLRQPSDFEYEQRMAVANRRMSGLPTVFLAPQPENMLISSTIVRDIYRNDGDVGPFVPGPITDALNKKRS